MHELRSAGTVLSKLARNLVITLSLRCELSRGAGKSHMPQLGVLLLLQQYSLIVVEWMREHRLEVDQIPMEG